MNIKSFKLIIDRSILFLLSLCIGVMPLIYFPYDKFSLVPYRIDVIFKPKQNFLIAIELILLFLFLIYFKLNKKSIYFKFNNIFIVLSSFYLILVLSTIFSDYSKIAVFGRPFRLEGLIAYSTYILLFIMIYIFIDNENKIKTLFYTLLSSAVIISIYGVMQFYNIDPIYKDPYIITGIYENRAFSTLGNPVFAGSYSSMLFTLVFILFFFSKGRNIYAIGFLNMLLFSFLLSTASKAGIIGAFFSIMFFLLIFRKKIKIYKKRLLCILLILIALTIIMELTGKPISPLKRFSAFFSNTNIKAQNKKHDNIITQKKGSIVFKKNFSRVYIYKTSFRLLLNKPLLGSGLDTFNKVFPQEEGRRLLDKAHNEYIQLGITAGIPALLLYLLLLFIIIIKNIKYHKQYNQYQLALFYAILAYWIQAVFNISVVSVAPIYWGLMGLNLAVIKTKKL